MKQNAIKQHDAQVVSPFVTAVRFALADTDTEQEALFDKILGKTPIARTEKDKVTEPLKMAKGQQHQDNENIIPAMGIETFLEMVRNDVDYRPDRILPSDLRTQLDEFRQDFISSVYGAKNIEELLKSLEMYVAKEHERLYYQKNDFMSASIKYDYFDQFTNALVKHLGEERQLEPDQLNRIEDIERIYKLGINAYNLACSKLLDATDSPDEMGTRSFLARAAQLRDEQIKQAGSADAPTVLTLEKNAHEVMRTLLFENYGIVSKSAAPSPLLLLLGDMTEKLALSQLQATHPHLDFRDPQLARGEMMEDRFVELLDTWQDRIKNKPSLQRTYDVYLDLQKQIHHAQQLPENFPSLLESSMKAAEKQAANRIPSIFAEHLKLKQVPVARAQKMIDALHPSFDTDETLTTDYWNFKGRMQGLKKTEDKYELIEFIENNLDTVAEEIALRGVHPAMALVAKEYLVAFRKHLGAALHKAGCHDERFLGALKELEMKADMVHENQREIGHWLMQDTNGGHDSLFHHTMMMLGTEPIIDNAEVDRISENASSGLIEAAENRGIQPSLSNQILVPLVYARCRDIAQAEIARDHTTKCNDFEVGNVARNATYWVDNVTATRKPSLGNLQDQYDERAPMPPQDILKQIRQRTLVLFDQAVSCLMPEHVPPAAETEEVDPEVVEKNAGNAGSGHAQHLQDEEERDDRFANYPIQFTAHNLRRIMEFLDHVDRNRNIMQLH